MMLPAERKLAIGADHVFAWRAPDGYPSSAPTLAVAWATPASYLMAVVRAADTVTAYDHATARLSITVAGPIAGAIRGIIAEHGGAAWLDGGPAYQGPVRVLGLVTDGSGAVVGPPAVDAVPAVLQLAEPLAHAAAVVGTWSLRWTTYTATVPQADIGTARLRNVKWTIPWTRMVGADAPSRALVARGILHVVHAPFDTGLSDESLLAYVPGWARMVPDRQSSWATQRDAALVALVNRLRPKLAAGRFEDDVSGEQFAEAHALYTASLIRAGQASLGYEGAAEDAADLATRGEAAMDRALGRLTYLDADDDGAVGAGEVGVVTPGALVLSHVTDSTWDSTAQAARRTNYWSDR